MGASEPVAWKPTCRLGEQERKAMVVTVTVVVIQRVTLMTVTVIMLMMKLEFTQPISHAGNCVNPFLQKPHKVVTTFSPLCKWQN